jgi:hypothetical protein
MTDILSKTALLIEEHRAEQAYRDAKRNHQAASKLYRKWVLAKARCAAIGL